jgi:hypothetical protein
LLVPSFTSKGFPFHRGKSKVGESLEYAETFLKDAALVSAYDVAYRHLPRLAGLRTFPARLPYSAPRVLFIDSGTYESKLDVDETQGRLSVHLTRPWSRRDHARCITELVDPRLPIVIVNYDSYDPIDRQVDAATDLFERHAAFLHDFLVKPEKSGDYIESAVILNVVDQLPSFDILGFTEKELGATLLDRMVTIASIRRGLDEAGCGAPIHVFGSLDPVLTPLYFIAGAEIFDGLAWLYLGTRDGMWIYGDQQAALSRNWTRDDRQRWAIRLQENLTMLENLQSALGRFVSSGGNWSELAPHSAALEEAYDTLEATLGV